MKKVLFSTIVPLALLLLVQLCKSVENAGVSSNDIEVRPMNSDEINEDEGDDSTVQITENVTDEASEPASQHETINSNVHPKIRMLYRQITQNQLALRKPGETTKSQNVNPPAAEPVKEEEEAIATGPSGANENEALLSDILNTRRTLRSIAVKGSPK